MRIWCGVYKQLLGKIDIECFAIFLSGSLWVDIVHTNELRLSKKAFLSCTMEGC